eukprot:4990772-Alexandrium_andersonii.AAC.1
MCIRDRETDDPGLVLVVELEPATPDVVRAAQAGSQRRVDRPHRRPATGPVQGGPLHLRWRPAQRLGRQL